MAKAELSWSLESGYSRFLREGRVDLSLEADPFKGKFDVSPWGLIRGGRTQEIEFHCRHRFRGVGPEELTWSLRPEGIVRSRILPPSSRYLGGFRVPGEHFAVHWRIELTVDSVVDRGLLDCGLLSVEAGSKLIHEWVEVFPKSCALASAIVLSWSNYISPLSALEAEKLGPGQTVSWSWRGGFSFRGDVEWTVDRGWSVGFDRPPACVETLPAIGVGLKTSFRFFKRGSFSLRLARRRGKLELRLVRVGQNERHRRFEAKATLGNYFRVDLDPELLEPAVEPIEERFLDALEKKVEISLALAALDWKRKRHVLRVLWSDTGTAGFRKSYSALLRGEEFVPRKDTKVSSVHTDIKGKRFSVLLNLFNWRKLGVVRGLQTMDKLRVTPSGNVLFETETIREQRRFAWDTIQFLRLYLKRENERLDEFRWEYSLEGELGLEDILRVLRPALRTGALEQFDVPGDWKLPTQGRILWVTAFRPDALQRMQSISRKGAFATLARSLELAQPELYRKGRPNRDWIESEELRSLVERDPVGASLSSKYPVPGRTSGQRQHVVTQYRKARTFLDLFHNWAEGEWRSDPEVIEGLNLEVPVFLFFHLMSPAEDRKSAILLSGAVDHLWGDRALVE